MFLKIAKFFVPTNNSDTKILSVTHNIMVKGRQQSVYYITNYGKRSSTVFCVEKIL